MEKHPNKYYLTQEQRTFYDDHGYLVIKGLIDIDTIANIRKRFQDICNNKVPKGQIVIVKDADLIEENRNVEECVNKINFLSFDPVFSKYFEHQRLLHVMSQFLGEEMTMYHSMMINKPPGSKWHPPHQDGFYVTIRPFDKVMTAWTAIDPVSMDNGCLFVIPGSHKQNILHPEVNVPNLVDKIFFTIPDVEGVAPVNRRASLAPMEPGDTVVFHPLLVHGSWPNSSNLFRKAIMNVYFSNECHYIDVKGTVQESFAREFCKARNEIHGSKNNNITYEEFMKAKCKNISYSLKSDPYEQTAA